MSIYDFVWTGLCFLLGFSFLVSVHELGHLLAMRAVKCSVEEFSIGFGRALFAKTIGKIRWKIGMIPLGGYVRSLERPRDFDEHLQLRDRLLSDGRSWETVYEMLEEDEYHENLSCFKQIVIYAMGPIFSFLLGWALLFGVYAHWGSENMVLPVRVAAFGENSPAEEAGIRIGDTLEEVNGYPITSFNQLVLATNLGRDKNIEVRFKRGSKSDTLIIPRREEAGISRMKIMVETMRHHYSTAEAIKTSLSDSINSFTETFQVIGLILSGEVNFRLSCGPVGMSQCIHSVRSSSKDYFQLLGYLSITLTSFNMLPLPLLDGGRICLSLAKCIFGRFITQEMIQLLMIASALLLLLMFIALTISDIARLFGI
jgi:regulator of sigma E protease